MLVHKLFYRILYQIWVDRARTIAEIGVPLKEGYNGDLTSAQAGSIGGEMVKKMIMKQEEQMSGK